MDQEHTTRYYPREEPEPSSDSIVSTKPLSDGQLLQLYRTVSEMEFVGTPVYILRLEDNHSSIPLLTRPEGAVLSEASYRKIMGRINSEEDFNSFRRELEPLALGLWGNINQGELGTKLE
jgi:hypothetical protein